MKERLQKIIAGAGVTSRRRAEHLILQGRVTVNGQIVTELGVRADSERDHVKVDGKRIRPEGLEYYLVNKPQGVLSSVSDPLRRPLVTELIGGSKRLYPAGRLDFQSEGLMIVTNDGDLTRLVTRGGGVEKVYRVKIRGRASAEGLELLKKGIRVGSEKFGGCKISLLKQARNCWYEVTLRQGRNRQIRRMFETIGHLVMRVRRTAIGPLSLGSVRPGCYRKMTAQEVRELKRRVKGVKAG